MSSRNAQKRAQNLMEGIYASDDLADFLRKHVNEFDDEVLKVLAEWAQDASSEGRSQLAEKFRTLISNVRHLQGRG
jgi:hypothetical protein